MKIALFAGLFALAAAPAAFAVEDATECQLEESRRSSRSDAAPPPPAPSAPAHAEREAVEPANAVARAEPPRRRGGKRIPDAELIGPRGAL